MIYLNNNTEIQRISIPYSPAPDMPVQKEIQSVKHYTVNVPGQFNITPDSGYSAMEKVGLTVDIQSPQEAYQSGYTYGYSSGYTDGVVSGTSVGYEEGVAEQKAKLTAVTIVENGQYNRPDGYSAVTVNVSGGSGYLITESADTNVYVALNTLGNSNNHNELRFGVVFKKFQDPFNNQVFLSFGSINFCVSNDRRIYAEHIYWPGEDPEWDEMDIYNNVTTDVLYEFVVNTNDYGKIKINDDFFETAEPERPYGNVILIPHLSIYSESPDFDGVFELRYLDYYSASGVSRTNLTQLSGGLQTQLLQPKLRGVNDAIFQNGHYTFLPETNDEKGFYGLSAVTLNINVRPAWNIYVNNRYRYAKQMCYANDLPGYSFNGTYLCHLNDNQTVAGVDIDSNGVITGYTGWGMVQIPDSDHYFKKDNDGYTWEAWVEDDGRGHKYLYWLTNANISELDAYGTGHGIEMYGYPLPTE